MPIPSSSRQSGTCLRSASFSTARINSTIFSSGKVENDADLKHVPLCREEEGIGICAGAYLAGKKTAIIMQNAGFLNSCNALTTTSLQFQIPILLLIYYAGDIGDRGFTTLGAVTEPVIQAMGFRSYVLRRREEIDDILRGAQILADDSKKPVAVLLTKSVLGVK